MDAGQVQEGENGGRRIHPLPHYYLRIYYYRRPTPWSPPFNFPMERRMNVGCFLFSSSRDRSQLTCGPTRNLTLLGGGGGGWRQTLYSENTILYMGLKRAYASWNLVCQEKFLKIDFTMKWYVLQLCVNLLKCSEDPCSRTWFFSNFSAL